MCSHHDDEDLDMDNHSMVSSASHHCVASRKSDYIWKSKAKLAAFRKLKELDEIDERLEQERLSNEQSLRRLRRLKRDRDILAAEAVLSVYDEPDKEVVFKTSRGSRVDSGILNKLTRDVFHSHANVWDITESRAVRSNNANEIVSCNVTREDSDKDLVITSVSATV